MKIIESLYIRSKNDFKYKKDFGEIKPFELLK